MNKKELKEGGYIQSVLVPCLYIDSRTTIRDSILVAAMDAAKYHKDRGEEWKNYTYIMLHNDCFVYSDNPNNSEELILLLDSKYADSKEDKEIKKFFRL
jgi:hypothetical protein